MLIGGVGTWAATAKLSGAIIGGGTVKVEQHVKEVQHRDGGTITSIAVREGDHVAAGQVLLTLDDVQIRAELAILSGQITEMKGRQWRLIAERDSQLAIKFPAGFGATPHEAAVRAGESKLFLGNLLNRSSQKSQLELQISQLDQEVEGLTAQNNALQDEIELVSAEHGKLKSLASKGLTEGSKVYQINRELSRMKGELGKIEAGIAQSEARKSETRVRILAIDEAAHNEAQRELRTVEANIREVESRYLAANDRLEDSVIRSPITGTVNELGVTTIGGVITPAAALASIVPDGADLKIEFKVRTSDIDQITVGQATKLKLSAFNQRTTPELDGIITHVSAAAQRDAQTGET
ncbi:MAG: HlyD family type I secretion periplasmic adaptor subunit, partial [Rhizobiaceae bacterium]